MEKKKDNFSFESLPKTNQRDKILLLEEKDTNVEMYFTISSSFSASASLSEFYKTALFKNISILENWVANNKFPPRQK